VLRLWVLCFIMYMCMHLDRGRLRCLLASVNPKQARFRICMCTEPTELEPATKHTVHNIKETIAAYV
jgi:hypothetical protein